MSPVFRSLALLGLVTCLMSGFMPVTAQAATRHHHHVVKKSRHHKKTHHSSAETNTRAAQTRLASLDYYKGKIDGVMGPKTRLAIRNFQRDHHLKVTGTLTVATYNAIIGADSGKLTGALYLNDPISLMPPLTPAPSSDFYTTHPDFYGYYDQQYENAGMLGFPQDVTSRYAKIELSENMSGAMKRYNVSVNGQPVLMTGDQPSIIGISNTYSIGSEDLILLTSYDDSNPVCVYAHHLLVLHDGGSHMLDIQNCTRGYQAKIANDSLIVTFPEEDDRRDVGATWRYEKGSLERL